MVAPALDTRLYVGAVTYVHNDLGQRSRGDVVEVTLTRAANVRLLDSSNWQKYKNGKDHRYHGGYSKESPARIVVPSSGRWHVVVDMQGLKGTTHATIKVINAASLRPLPPLRQPSIRRQQGPTAKQQIAEIVDNAFEQAPALEADYDLFLSHASEDKDAVARPLAQALRDRGISVWFDEFTMRIGDSLRQRIDGGIAKAKFGLVILSEAFFAKGWTQYELDGLVAMSVSTKQTLLPIWHEITAEAVADHSPSLAGRFALSTSKHTVEELADEIADVIKERREQ